MRKVLSIVMAAVTAMKRPYTGEYCSAGSPVLCSDSALQNSRAWENYRLGATWKVLLGESEGVWSSVCSE